MPCLLALIVFLFPRATLAVMWFVGYTATAFQSNIWPLLGFLFMPYTTCAYTIAIHGSGEIRGVGLALVILGVVLDLGSNGDNVRRSKRR